MDVGFVSSNPDKFREVEAILRPFGLRPRWICRTLPEPQADRLEPVVRAKLAALPDDGGTYLVEDSGLFLEGLNGFPGVYSSYVYRTIGLDGVLRLLRDRSRSAVFRTVAGIRHRGRVVLTTGISNGSIAPRERGSGGFGYDPVFVPSGERRTFAQMSREEKNRFSHRGRAIRHAGAKLAHLGRSAEGAHPGPRRRSPDANVD